MIDNPKQGSPLNSSRIRNVGGWQNNCGANVFLHFFIDNWDFIPFDQPPYTGFIQHLAKAYSIEPSADAVKQALDGLNYVEQEMVFGSAVREHITHTLAHNQSFQNSQFESFEMAMTRKIAGLDVDAADRKFLEANEPLVKTIQDIFQHFVHERDLNWDALDQHDKVNEMDNFWIFFNQFAAQQKDDTSYLRRYWDLSGFHKTLHYMGDHMNAYMFSQDELQLYAKEMKLGIQMFYRGQDLTMDDQTDKPLLNITLVNGGAHWQYKAPDHIKDDVIAANNQIIASIAPEDRNNRFKSLIEAPEMLKSPSFVQSVMATTIEQINLTEFSPLLHWCFAPNSLRQKQAFVEANQELNQLLDTTDLTQDEFEEAFDQASTKVMACR